MFKRFTLAIAVCAMTACTSPLFTAPPPMIPTSQVPDNDNNYDPVRGRIVTVVPRDFLTGKPVELHAYEHRCTGRSDKTEGCD